MLETRNSGGRLLLDPLNGRVDYYLYITIIYIIYIISTGCSLSSWFASSSICCASSRVGETMSTHTPCALRPRAPRRSVPRREQVVLEISSPEVLEILSRSGDNISEMTRRARTRPARRIPKTGARHSRASSPTRPGRRARTRHAANRDASDWVS